MVCVTDLLPIEFQKRSKGPDLDFVGLEVRGQKTQWGCRLELVGPGCPMEPTKSLILPHWRQSSTKTLFCTSSNEPETFELFFYDF